MDMQYYFNFCVYVNIWSLLCESKCVKPNLHATQEMCPSAVKCSFLYGTCVALA